MISDGSACPVELRSTAHHMRLFNWGASSDQREPRERDLYLPQAGSLRCDGREIIFLAFDAFTTSTISTFYTTSTLFTAFTV